MNKAALTLAALTFGAFGALSGPAFAGNSQPAKQVPVTACTQKASKAKLDCGPTGSIEKAHPMAGSTRDANGPRLGIDVNPWFLPNTF